ncbi:MAG: hypothetical protein AB1607_04815 [Chloroflexota bacterium]
MNANPNENNPLINAQSGSMLLRLLLCTDVAFIILHISYFQTPLLESSLYSLSRDNGFSEFFQYIKFLWIIILLVDVSLKTKTLGYMAWVLLFVYFLADDSLQLHESFGRVIAGNLNVATPLNLRLQDIGELIASAIAGAVLFPLLILAYWRGSQNFRKISRDLLVFLILLIFVGIGIDMAHEGIGAEGMLDRLVFRVLEEGGEMTVTSLILWYIFLLSSWNGNVGWYVHERLRALVSKGSV